MLRLDLVAHVKVKYFDFPIGQLGQQHLALFPGSQKVVSSVETVNLYIVLLTIVLECTVLYLIL